MFSIPLFFFPAKKYHPTFYHTLFLCKQLLPSLWNIDESWAQSQFHEETLHGLYFDIDAPSSWTIQFSPHLSPCTCWFSSFHFSLPVYISRQRHSGNNFISTFQHNVWHMLVTQGMFDEYIIWWKTKALNKNIVFRNIEHHEKWSFAKWKKCIKC